MRFRLDISYDGTNFSGWGVQPRLRTVQGEIENALCTILRLKTPSRLIVAGRTDTGVHARGQVAHVDLADDIQAEHLCRRLRNLLPKDIQIRDVQPAPFGFDARFSALERQYVYRICDEPVGPDPLSRDFVAHHFRRIDVTAMNYASQHLLGEHDFASFCRPREGATTIRALRNLHSIRRDDGIIETTVIADAFCHSMVRSLMGAITAVGATRYEPSWAASVLAAQVRQSHVEVMPAHGLTLEHVVYPPDDALAARALESRRRRDSLKLVP
ncbi:MAG: tRNA pseudouridine(38-40) synthase TruA [Actinomycetota bacterium]|nr:tRNA pseudouridine(38-40) synthase TruA [Actinomycetota bacterium]